MDNLDIIIANRRLKRLTPALREIAIAVQNGARTHREVATIRGRNLSTIKQQLRQIYDIFGIDSFLELVILMDSLPKQPLSPEP
jgi:DNA-binding CsgD family transcriptional regulator